MCLMVVALFILTRIALFMVGIIPKLIIELNKLCVRLLTSKSKSNHFFFQLTYSRFSNNNLVDLF